MLNVLIACEESQAVCKEFRRLGHRAFSCDIQECSGGHPEWHIQGDVLPVINGRCSFVTCDGKLHEQAEAWDLIIAHPPCTYLSGAGNAYFNIERYGEKAIQRHQLRKEAAEFFMKFINADCLHVGVENPIGYMNGHFRKPDQIIQPYYFAESAEDKRNYHQKTTCLWLKGLLPLKRTNNLSKPEPIYVDRTGKKRYYTEAIASFRKDSKVMRSKTFPGIARAMAEQWSEYIEKEKNQ